MTTVAEVLTQRTMGPPPEVETDAVNGRVRFKQPAGTWTAWIELAGLQAALAAGTAAQGHATTAGGHATGAQTARTGAETARDAAAASATTAGGHATAAQTARTGAESARDTAAGHATTAGTQATGAAASATAAAGSATTASGHATTAGTQATAAQTARTGAEAARTAAETARDTAAGSATTASGHATTAGTHATAAAGSATTASGHATTAGTQATAAQTARTGAETARTLAQDWAEKADNADVAGVGTRSAKHWAGQAAATVQIVKTASVTVDVAAGGDIQAALDNLNGMLFVGVALGIVRLASGTYTTATALVCRHPQGPERIRLVSAVAPTAVAAGDLTGDAATDRALLAARFPVKILCSGGGLDAEAPSGGLAHVDGIYFERSGAVAGTGIRAGRFGVLGLNRVAVSGFSSGVLATAGGVVAALSSGSTTVSCHNNLNLSADIGADVSIGGLFAYSTAGAGSFNCQLDTGAEWRPQASVTILGAFWGLLAQRGSRFCGPVTAIREYGTYGLAARTGSQVVLTGPCEMTSGLAAAAAVVAIDARVTCNNAITLNDSNSAGARTFSANYGAIIYRNGGVTGTGVYSPAVGVRGNFEGLIL